MTKQGDAQCGQTATSASDCLPRKMKTLEEVVAQITVDMHLPEGFLLALKTEDDWSFVIKAHVFLEALLSHAITASLQPHNSKVAHPISSLHMWQKIKLAKALELIGPDGVKFLKEISEARNTCAHDISDLSFSFKNLFKDLSANRKESSVRALAYFASEEDLRERWETVQELMISDTKQSIWWSLLHFAGVMWWKTEKAKLDTLHQLLRQEFEKLKLTIA
jgi:hypothetical protein